MEMATTDGLISHLLLSLDQMAGWDLMLSTRGKLNVTLDR